MRERAVALDVRLLVPALVAWAGALIAARGSAMVAMGLATACALLGGLTLLLADRRVFALAGLCGLATSLTVGAAAVDHVVRHDGLLPTLVQQRATVRLQARVISDPVQVPSRFGGDEVWRVRLEVSKISGRGSLGRSAAQIMAFGDHQLGSLRWHQEIALGGRLQPSSLDPAESTVLVSGPIRLLKSAGPIEQAAERVRSAVRAATDGLPGDPAGLVPALVIGDTSRLPDDLNADMKATGMTHLNAVSGSNVTVVMLAAGWACGWLRVPRRLRVPLTFLALTCFVFLCRPEPSVIRAAVMGAVGLLALRSSGARAAPPALATAIVVLLVVQPPLASSYGFALSALATLGLILFARPWAAAIAERLPNRFGWLGEAIAVPLAAQTMCAPVTVLLQPTVSLIGLPANMLAAPFVGPATIAGVVVAVLAVPVPFLAAIVAWAAGLPAWAICLVARRCADVPYGRLPWAGGLSGALLLAAVTAIVLFTGAGLLARARRSMVAAPAALCVGIAVWAPLPVGNVPAGWLVMMCDVGQGDATLVRSAPGHAVLIDTGPDPQAMRRCLDDSGVKVLDAIVLTHFHADHVDGLAAVIEQVPVGEIIGTFVDEEAATGKDEPGHEQQALAVVQRSGRSLRRVHAGETLRWNGIAATVLWPVRAIHAGSLQNNASVVLDLQVAGVRMLFTGDIEKEAAARVLSALRALHDPTPFSVLKVPHHGSSNQVPELIHLVAAPISLIGVGADNDYGHPAARTVALLEADGSAVLRTDIGGAIRLYRRGAGFGVVRGSGQAPTEQQSAIPAASTKASMVAATAGTRCRSGVVTANTDR
ncbi:ComEC/Rec2 family competence protein [Calidifontibacter terrae]